MRVITHISPQAYTTLESTGVLIPLNTPDTEKSKAYKTLEEITGYSSFFFGVGLDGPALDFEVAGLTGQKANTVRLEVEIEDYWIHDFYTFSDLIYYSYFEPKPQICENIKNLLSDQQITPNEPHQVIYPHLDTSAIIRITHL